MGLDMVEIARMATTMITVLDWRVDKDNKTYLLPSRLSLLLFSINFTL